MSTDEVSNTTDARPPLALIAGPTASGKSDLAVRLALAHEVGGGKAVVINADSAQVYADLAVLSARPAPQETRGIEHRLFGTWDGADACSAADWAAAARREIDAAHAAGALPVLVGGTGLYIRTLLDGIAPIPAIEPELREAVRALPQSEARAALEREDPGAAARLPPADTTRTARALEVVRSTGRTLAEWQLRRIGGIGAAVDLHPVILLPARPQLAARCDARFAAMMERGSIDEVRALLDRQLDPALPVMRAIGVREIAAWLRGETTRDEAIAAGQLATRQYAKRQYTWLRHQPPTDWVRADTESYDPLSHFASLLRR